MVDQSGKIRANSEDWNKAKQDKVGSECLYALQGT